MLGAERFDFIHTCKHSHLPLRIRIYAKNRLFEQKVDTRMAYFPFSFQYFVVKYDNFSGRDWAEFEPFRSQINTIQLLHR